MYPYKCFRILTLDLACPLYEQCVFQHNMQYSVQVKSGVQMRKDWYGHLMGLGLGLGLGLFY